ncbi:DUF624 domain-containing protein [Xylanimonas sp. McL0601]|uniref:DUF624 domain-containing protein n=1 Tax=Xylanimonas sp. McL0601 TaxID=3414739 RepID=UPI003CF36CDF
MTAEQPTPRLPGDFAQGPLGRLTAGVYWFVVVTALLAVTAFPSVVVLLLLDRSASNVPVLALAAVPLGPALSAALFATRDRVRAEDLAPARSFWKGYRLNWADVLRVWVPALVVLAIIAYVLANAQTAGLGAPYVVVLAVIGFLVAIAALHAVAIASIFSFRARDVARLATFYIFSKPSATVSVVSLLIVVGGLGTLLSALVPLLGGVWVWFWYRGDLRMLDDIEKRFTHQTD